jgi:hypothetical protein
MLIIEGSDRLGKTTAINKMRALTAQWNPPILYSHMSRPNEEKFDFYKDYRPLISTYTIQDRFHLGGIVWHDAISQCHLRRIEAWLDLVASKTIVLFASDFRWYEKWIKEDDRGNLLSDIAMIEANQEYYSMAMGRHPLHPKIDFSWDVKSQHVDEPQFVDLDTMQGWIRLWKDSLNLLGDE